MDDIYRKTERGLVEMNTRELRLAPRLRSALIMIDGKKMSRQLQGVLGPDCAEMLQVLEELGLIEPIRPIYITDLQPRR
jgi:hypothetical protein